MQVNGNKQCLTHKNNHKGGYYTSSSHPALHYLNWKDASLRSNKQISTTYKMLSYRRETAL